MIAISNIKRIPYAVWFLQIFFTVYANACSHLQSLGRNRRKGSDRFKIMCYLVNILAHTHQCVTALHLAFGIYTYAMLHEWNDIMVGHPLGLRNHLHIRHTPIHACIYQPIFFMNIIVLCFGKWLYTKSIIFRQLLRPVHYPSYTQIWWHFVCMLFLFSVAQSVETFQRAG